MAGLILSKVLSAPADQGRRRSALSGYRPATHNHCNNQDGLRPGFECSAARRVEGKMSEKIYDVSSDWAKRAFVDDAKYRAMYASSVADPNAFWAEQGKRI